jgi:4-diphosphocytidyl-2-C-methyl-D-erythritol kinase
MTVLRDIAWAKLNVTLEVLGRRADGFHELRSLVGFAGLGDTVELVPEQGLGLQAEGPFAAPLDDDNLIIEAARAAHARNPALTLGRFHLVKSLPVAAGLGGGSADAAAALRLVGRANPKVMTEEVTAEIAPNLGSDITACLRSAPVLMTGRGEEVTPVGGFPSCSVLLANPRVPLASKDVYQELKAAPIGVTSAMPEILDFSGDFEKLIDYAQARANDLEPVAVRLVPAIEGVLAALRTLQGARLVRLSGSGPTCFALFATPQEAHGAAALLAQHEPDWWIASGMFGDPVSAPKV